MINVLQYCWKCEARCERCKAELITRGVVLKYARAYIIIEERGKKIKKENLNIGAEGLTIELKELAMLMIQIQGTL